MAPSRDVPVHLAIFSGHLVLHQINALIFAMTIEACLRASRHEDARAGCLIGLAASVKVTPALLLPYFLLQRRWKLLGAAVCVALLSALAVVPVLGWRGALDAHSRWVTRTVSLRGIHGTRNQSIHALAERLGTSEARLEGVGVAPPIALSQSTADRIGKFLALALALAGALAMRKCSPQRAAASLLPISVLSATYCWRPQYIAFAPLIYLTLRRLAAKGDVYDWLLAVSFLLATLEREQGVVGDYWYYSKVPA